MKINLLIIQGVFKQTIYLSVSVEFVGISRKIRAGGNGDILL